MTLLTDLGISSPNEAAELELDLGVRFNDFTPEDADTWNRQTLYLNQYARTRTFTHAARAAGVSLRHARTWQSENTLGFNHRLEIAVLEYTEEIEVILLEQVRQPKPSPALLAMLLRAHLPEKYGPARRDSAPRDNHHDHDDDPMPETPKEDRESLEDIRRDLQNLKLFAGLTDPPNLSPTDQAPIDADSNPAPVPSPTGRQTQTDGVPTPSDQAPIDADSNPAHAPSPAPVGAGFKPAPVPSPTGRQTQKDDVPTPSDQPPVGPESNPAHAPSSTPVGAGLKLAPVPSPTGRQTQTDDIPSPTDQPPVGPESNPAPTLNRRQRRQLQRKQRKQRKHAPYPNTGTKQPNSHRSRAPN